MHFGFYIPYFREGGVETTTYRLASGFTERGHNVDLVTFGHDTTYLGPNSPFNLVTLDASRTLTSIPDLVRYLRRRRPEVMLSTHYYANLANIFAQTISGVNVCTVLTERLYVSRIIAEEPWPKSWVFPRAMRAIYPLADHCVTVSKDAAMDLRELAALPPEQVTAIYNPTLTDDVYERAEKEVDHPWLDSDRPVVLAVGRLTDQKGFDTLVDSFAQLLEKRDAWLIILGEGEDREGLESLASEHGIDDRIDLPGYVDNPYAYMREADVFVLSSRYEGMPNVIVEAAAIGTPLVATDCPSGPRELLNGGEAGELVPVEDPHEMAEAIDRQLTHPERARRRVERIEDKLQQFTPETACDRYLSLFTDNKET